MFYVRQGATHKVVIGPAVAIGDGITPVTNLALTTADEAEVILHNDGTVVDISGYTFAAIATADGYYHLTLAAGISGIVGHMTVVINDDSLCLPVRADFMVIEEAVYDAMYAVDAAGPNTTVPDAAGVVETAIDALETHGDDTWAATGGVAGSGALSTRIYCQTDGGVPIDGVEVWITSDEAGTNVVAGTLSSDATGLAGPFMLDAGTWFVWKQLSGYNFTNPIEIVVA